MHDYTLCLGANIGKVKDLLPKFEKLFPNKHDFTVLEYTEYLTRKLPGSIYVNIHYPTYGCELDECDLHISMIGDNKVSWTDLEDIVCPEYEDNDALSQYGYVLNLLDININVLPPSLYVLDYIY